MKRYAVIALLALSACGTNSKDNSKAVNNSETLSPSLVSNPRTADGLDASVAETKPVFAFKDTVFQFGTIHEGETVSYDFEFTNTGKTPLIISQASATCGCTVADYPKDPIAPGKSGIVKVSFHSAGKSGTQQKTVILHANTLRNAHMLYLQGIVVKEK
jgi:hypothetical protein